MLKHILPILTLCFVAVYFSFSYFWLRVDFTLTTGIDFVILDDADKVKRIHGEHAGAYYSEIATDVETTSEKGPLMFEEYYLKGEFDHLTCDAAPNCPGGKYMRLRNCYIIPAFIIDGIGIIALILLVVTLLKYFKRKVIPKSN